MKTLLMLQVCFAYCPLLIESKVIVIVKQVHVLCQGEISRQTTATVLPA